MLLSIKQLFIGCALVLFISGCGVQQVQHVQSGNLTGKVIDNRWDYYDGNPVHYTSTQRTLVSDGMMAVNEVTDSFSATVNMDRSSNKSLVTFNSIIIKLKEATEAQKKHYYDVVIPDTQKNQFPDYQSLKWDKYMISEDGKLMLTIEYEKQIITVAKFEETSETIAYLPSRYLACKKVSDIQVAQSAAMARSLLKTALVAGIQSYTSYSSVDAWDGYGNFGYATVRDYSWAGERGGDALTTLFNGDSSSTALTAAWDSLSCY